MSTAAFNHIYTPEENLDFIKDSPNDFVEGVFSVPDEITSWDQVQVPAADADHSQAFRIGQDYAANWAMKNGRLNVAEFQRGKDAAQHHAEHGAMLEDVDYGVGKQYSSYLHGVKFGIDRIKAQRAEGENNV